MTHLYKIRLLKSAVKKFPFDVFYLTGEAEKPLLPKLFPWSLCVVITEPIRALLAAIRVDITEVREHRQPREKLPLKRSSEHMLPRLVPLDDCLFITVPILPLTRRGMKKAEKPGQDKTARFAPYLMSPKLAKDEKEPLVTNVLDDDAVLFTPDGPVRPICHKCPRILFHLQGECQLGCRTCYEELTLWQPEVPNEQLQADHADDDRNTAAAE